VNDPPPLVLRVLRAVRAATGDRKPPHWIGLDALTLRIDQFRLGQAIALAERAGWLKVAGHPPLTVAITPAGLAALEHAGGGEQQEQG
jgi:hypothetical protein